MSGAIPELLHKLEGSTADVTGLAILPGEDGILSSSLDTTVRVWLLRDSGQFWPSVCHNMPSPATSIDYQPRNRQVCVGLDNGTVAEFNLAADYNSLAPVREYFAHNGRVTSVCQDVEKKWLISVGNDKSVQLHCMTSGKRLGGYACQAWCTVVDYDEEGNFVFVGEYSGAVTVCKASERGLQHISTLRGHQGSIRGLAWDGTRGWLFSGSFDSRINVWDIGGGRGSVYELQGHRGKVTALAYSKPSQRLLSVGEDQSVTSWDLTTARKETPAWADSSSCQDCGKPFFWNFRGMYEQRTVGYRQHHCRRCGSAICAPCSPHQSTLPELGYELEVRLCNKCQGQVTDREKVSKARGKGLIATKKILKGTVVLVESPVLTVKNYNEEKNVIKALNQTTSNQRKIILELFNPNSNDEEYNSLDNKYKNQMKTMLDIFNCNSLESFHEPDNGNLYRTLSRINHSCVPNVLWSGIKDDWHKAELRVCVNIEEGEELVASYLGTGHYSSRETRRDELRTIWGFNCDCSLCSLTGENLEQNEKARKNINLLSENVKEFIDSPVESAEKAFCSAIERLELVIKHENEMLEGLLDAFIDCYILSSFLVGIHEENMINKDTFLNNKKNNIDPSLENKIGNIDPKFYKDKALTLAGQLGDCYVRDCHTIIAHMEEDDHKETRQFKC